MRVSTFAIPAILALVWTNSGYAAEVPRSLHEILGGKEKFADQLIEQVEYCSKRRDTRWPVFSSCIDWHSSVHGLWALAAYDRMTNTTKHRSELTRRLNAADLEREYNYLVSNPSFEFPYGRAWFLRLAIELRGTDLESKIDKIAAHIFRQFLDHYSVNPPNPLTGDYESDTWAFINLLDYSLVKNDNLNHNLLLALANKHIVIDDLKCSYKDERGFMAVCTNIAAVATRTLDGSEFASWWAKFRNSNGDPAPVRTPTTAHQYGLNFSRAWGLWDVYNKSNDLKAASLYSEHFFSGMTPRSNWSGNYSDVGHWVAQFGIFALQPTFGRETGR